jgi:CRP-like cAMP-binding protein
MFPTRSARADRSALAGVAPFDRYDARTLAPLGRHADRLRVREGTVLAQAGRPVREVIRVLAGEVAVITPGGVERRGAGTWVGAEPMLARTAQRATVVAGPGLEVLVLPAPAFRWAAQVLPGLVAGVRGPASGDVPAGDEGAGHGATTTMATA